MDEIDPLQLPASALLDTTVLIPALGGKPKPTDDPMSRKFWDAMVTARRRILIAAPSAAELIRRSPSTAIPRARHIVVVPFDDLAADKLGTQFPPTILVQARNEIAGSTMNYIKYDAMIVACALRHNAKMIISSDDGVRALAGKVGLPVKVPSNFIHGQGTMFAMFTSPAPTQSKPEPP